MSSPEADPIIEMRDVTIASWQSAHPKPRISEINWDIRPRDFWVVGGFPGAGKTDLLVTAAGLQRPMRGSLRIFGRDVASLTDEELVQERLKIGVVFENGGRLFSHLTLLDNVVLPLCYHHDLTPADAQQEALGILEALEAADHANLTPQLVSRAMRQRAALARALALKPSAILLDNPLAGMDPRQAAWWRQCLDLLQSGHPALGRHPAAVVVTTDDFRSLLHCGCQFVLIKQHQWMPLGRLAEMERNDEPLLKELLARM